MNEFYYIPFVYVDAPKLCSDATLLEARAECLVWFYERHPNTLIILGPLFNLD